MDDEKKEAPLLPELTKNETRGIFESLNVEEKFKKNYKLDRNTRCTDFIPLPGISSQDEQFYYISLSQGNLYTSIMFINTPDGLMPTGHMDYTQSSEKQEDCIACFDTISKIVQSILDLKKLNPELADPPAWLIQAKKHFIDARGGEIDHAIRIDDKYQGKGLSKPLIYLTLAQAQMDGFTKLHIGGDATKGKKAEKAKGLYKYLGAKSIIEDKPSFGIITMPDGSLESEDSDMAKVEQIWFNIPMPDRQIPIIKQALQI